MRIEQTYSYRHAEGILKSEYPAEMREIRDVFKAAKWAQKSLAKERSRDGRVVARLSLDQIATNKQIDAEFVSRGWKSQPKIIGTGSNLVADFRKGKIQVEVQFGNMARWYTDVFKFLVSYSADDIEIGVLVVPMKAISQEIDENVVYFERVLRELPHAKMGITIPIWVIGLGL